MWGGRPRPRRTPSSGCAITLKTEGDEGGGCWHCGGQPGGSAPPGDFSANFVEGEHVLVEFEKFVFSLIGAILGGSFVAWIGGYYAERGQRDLLREEWAKVLQEAREKAHAEEAGKRLATKED